MEKTGTHFKLHDVTEIIIGSVILAFPIAVTEEVWELSRELPFVRTLFISFCSIAFIGWFGYHLFYGASLLGKWGDFFLRITTVYLVTLTVSALILAAIDQLPLLTEPIVALKRTIIVALPASFSATVVDSLH